MLRGAEKRMIVVRTRGSRMFEEAYFVVRPEAERTVSAETDMLREANRILESSLGSARREELCAATPALPRSGLLRGIVCFLAGLVTGGGLVSLLWVLL